MTASTTAVDLYVGEVIYEPELSASNKMAVGFYQSDTYYGIETGVSLHYNASENTAVQFNVSGSKYSGTFPITIKMKDVALRCR